MFIAFRNILIIAAKSDLSLVLGLFVAVNYEKRIGGRKLIAGDLILDDFDVVITGVHFELHSRLFHYMNRSLVKGFGDGDYPVESTIFKAEPKRRSRQLSSKCFSPLGCCKGIDDCRAAELGSRAAKAAKLRWPVVDIRPASKPRRLPVLNDAL